MRHGFASGLLAVAALVVGALVVGACDARLAPGGAAPAAYAAGEACSAANRPATVLTPRIDGRVRLIRTHLPTGYPGHRSWALVLNLHGTGSSAAHQEALSGMDATADARGFIVAYPQGARRAGTGFGWTVPGPGALPRRGIDDLSFLAQVRSLLRRTYCVDSTRIYATGFSGGARLLSQYACQPGSMLAAIAAVGGLRAPAPCAAGRPVPVLALHGTADTQNPYGGHGAAYWTYSVPVAAARWAAYDGCAAAPVTSQPFPGTTLTRYPGCQGGASVELYTLAGRGHQWPPGPDPDADELIWRFFAAHPLR